MAKKINKKENENKAILEIVIQCGLQALIISLFTMFLFGEGNATIVTILSAIRESDVSAWQIAVVAFPILFVACTVVQLVAFVIKGKK